MNRQFETAWQLHTFLSARGIPYAIIGGIAVQRWGQPRLTRDVDITILLPPGSEEPVLREIIAVFPARSDRALRARLGRVRSLPVSTLAEGIRGKPPGVLPSAEATVENRWRRGGQCQHP